jgi:hypothetical protein
MFDKLDKLFSNKAIGESPTLDEDVSKWLREIDEGKKREKEYRKQGKRCVKLYEGEDSDGQPVEYNILFANTDTLAPALYNNTPRPVVKHRFAGDNPAISAGVKVLQQALVSLLDGDQSLYTPFDDLQKGAVLQALVPGRGAIRFKYDPTIETVTEATDTSPAEERLTYETVCGEEIPWNRLVYGFASTWQTVPWIAIEHIYTRFDLIQNFGEEIGGKISLTVSSESSDEGEKKDLPNDSEGVKLARVYEVWDKSSRENFFISEGYKSRFKVEKDPYKLDGFFPIPRPLQLVPKIDSLTPIPPYLMYEEQAKELNQVTRRITKLTSMLKARGFYDSTIQGIEELMKSEDGTLIPAKNVAAMQQGWSLDKAVWMSPLETVSSVLQQLYANRDAVKQVIFEISGLADILRGSSRASETLGAQKMKEAWGTMRLKRQQKEVQRHAKDSLRLMAELVVNHFTPETLEKMTGIKLPRRAALPQMQAQAAYLQDQQTRQGMEAQAQGLPPSPPNPQLAQLQKELNTPTWEDVLEALRDDFTRNYLIDIETNSTIDAEATEDREQVNEFMNAMGQLTSGLVPMMEKGYMPFQVAKGYMLGVTQKFRFGQEMEELLRNMQEPPPKADPAAEKAKAEAARDEKRFQQEQEMAAQELAAKREEQQMKLAAAKEKHRVDMGRLRMEEEIAIAEHRRKMQEMAMEAMMPRPVPATSQPAAS